MRIVGKMRMDLSDKRNNSRRVRGMTRLGHSVPKINPWALCQPGPPRYVGRINKADL
jgi:hypothetical protein